MTGMHDLLCWARELKIDVRYRNLQKKTPGLLGKANAAINTITLDTSLKLNPREHKCVLAEEIGHILFPPRPGHIAYHRKGYWYKDSTERCFIKGIVAQDERKALDWATGVLMPDVVFCRFIENGDKSLPEIADYFDVEEWFAKFKIAYVRRKAKLEGKRLSWG